MCERKRENYFFSLKKPPPSTIFDPQTSPVQRNLNVPTQKHTFAYSVFQFLHPSKRQKRAAPLFLSLSLSPAKELSTLLCKLLTKQFLVPLETITLQENTTLLSRRASESNLPLVGFSSQTRLLKLGTNLPLVTHTPTLCGVVRVCSSPCPEQTAQITEF